MTAAIVHVGIPKTGTTTLQRVLWRNRQSLEEQGICYDNSPHAGRDARYVLVGFDRIGRLPADPHLRFLFGLRTLDDQARIVRALEDEIRENPKEKRLISCETIGLPNRDPLYISALSEWFNENFETIEYIIYLREQADWMVSLYSEAVKRGEKRSVETYMEKSTLPNFNLTIRRWEDAVGVQNLNVRLFDTSYLKDGDLLADFAEVIGSRPLVDTLNKTLNKSLGARQIGALRRMNTLCAPIDKALDKPTFIQSRRRVISRWFNDTKRFTIDTHIRERIRALSVQSNENLRLRRFPDRDSLFSI